MLQPNIDLKTKRYLLLDLLALMESKNIYVDGRYAKWQYSAMDDSMEQAFALANKI